MAIQFRLHLVQTTTMYNEIGSCVPIGRFVGWESQRLVNHIITPDFMASIIYNNETES